MPAAERWLPRLPSPLAIFALALGGVLVGITVTKGVSDPDYFWHVVTGQLIAQHASIPTTDPYSFTWYGQPWTLHEWLSELLMYWIVTGLGLTAALVVWGLFPAAIVGAQAGMLSRMGVGVRAFAAPAILIGLVVSPHVTLRPQAVSWLLLSVLLLVLAGLRSDRPRRALLLVPLFVLWANLHGVYVIGLGVVAVYVLFTLAGRTPMRGAAGWMVGAGLGCVAASMLTPAGPVGILYPLRYVDAGDWGLANILEWQSPNFHDPAQWPFLLLILAVAVNGGRGTPGWLTTLSLVGVALGLAADRNVPIAAVLCLPTLALGVSERLRAREAARPPKRPMRADRALARRVLELGTAAIVVAGALLALVPRGVGAALDEHIAERYPVAAVDVLAMVEPNARVLAEYGWGGYVIYRLHATGGLVFVDGRNDMYAQSILEEYSHVRAADPGWQEIVDDRRVNAMLWPPTVRIAEGPALEAGWCEAHRDAVAVLFLRECPG